MRIVPVRLNTDKQPSFQSKVVITPAAKKVLERKFSPDKFTVKTFQQVISEYISAMESITSEVKGEIRIFHRKSPKNSLRVVFLDKSGAKLRCDHFSYARCLEHYLEGKMSLDDTVIANSANLGDAFAKYPLKFGKDKVQDYSQYNPFVKVVRRLLYKQLS